MSSIVPKSESSACPSTTDFLCFEPHGSPFHAFFPIYCFEVSRLTAFCHFSLTDPRSRLSFDSLSWSSHSDLVSPPQQHSPEGP